MSTTHLVEGLQVYGGFYVQLHSFAFRWHTLSGLLMQKCNNGIISALRHETILRYLKISVFHHVGASLIDGDIDMEEKTPIKEVPTHLLVSLEDAVKNFAEMVSKGYTGDETKLLETYAKLLAGRLKPEKYPSLDAFLEAHLQGRTALAMLEGEPVELHRGFIYVLNKCLYAATAAKYARVDEKLLKTFQRIVEAYNKNKNPATPIVNPFCVLHDRLRQLYLDKVEFGGKKLKFYVVARKSPWDPKKSILNEVLAKKLRKPIREALEEIMSKYYSCCCFIPKKKIKKEALAAK